MVNFRNLVTMFGDFTVVSSLGLAGGIGQRAEGVLGDREGERGFAFI
jgi:hypothetical protein